MTSKAKSSTKSDSKTPAAVKAAPEALKAPAEAKRQPRIVPPGTMQTTVGPKGGKLVAPTTDDHNVTEEQRQGERRQQNTIAQFVNTSMQTPAAHAPQLTAEQQKKAEFDAEMAKLAAQYGQPLPTAPTRARAASNKVVKNNITRPATGTLTGDVWDAADEITIQNGGQAAQIAQVREHAKLSGHNDHTIKTQFARWRAFHGVTGRAVVVKVAAPTQPQGEYDGVPQVSA